MVVWDWRSPYHWSRYKVVAWFPGMDAAREAISSLGGSAASKPRTYPYSVLRPPRQRPTRMSGTPTRA